MTTEDKRKPPTYIRDQINDSIAELLTALREEIAKERLPWGMGQRIDNLINRVQERYL